MQNSSSQRKASLSPAKRLLLEKRLQARNPGNNAPGIVALGHRQNVPLSYAQDRLWFLEQLQPGTAAFNMPFAVRLRGKLDKPALRRTVGEIVRRHEVLRTRFPERNGAPMQETLPEIDFEGEELDLRALPATDRAAEALHRASLEANRPFDLQRGPLLRMKLLQVEEQEHLLLLTMHHIVSDGWSVGIMAEEFCRLYEAFSRNQPSPLPDLPLQYADFTAWQRKWLTDEVLDRHVAYWKERLQGAVVLELPPDHSRSPHSGSAGATLPVRISAGQTESLKQIARQNDVTLFIVLLAVFDVLLSQHASEDIVVGTDIANRNWLGTEGMIGFFVNQLVLRTDMSGDPPFPELLARARKTVYEAYEHQDVPFETLVAELAPVRNPGRSPFFETKLVFQNFPERPASLGELDVHFDRNQLGSSQLDLTLTLGETHEGIQGVFRYRADRFTVETIHLWKSQYLELIASILETPAVCLSSLRRTLASIEQTHRTECRSTMNRLLNEKLRSKQRPRTEGVMI